MADNLTKFRRKDATGVKVLLRNHLDHGNAFDCLEICQYVAHARIGISLSTHACAKSRDGFIDGVLRAALPWLHLVALADRSASGEPVPLGDGIIQHERIIAFLDRSGYGAYVGVWADDLWRLYPEN